MQPKDFAESWIDPEEIAAQRRSELRLMVNAIAAVFVWSAACVTIGWWAARWMA